MKEKRTHEELYAYWEQQAEINRAARGKALADSRAACTHYVCVEGAFGPTHAGSSACRQRASWASGGTTSHCTCNGCW